MGDGVVRKYAIIINGDSEARHLANVTRAAKVLKRGGYKLHVASPQKPGLQVAGYVYPTLAKVKKLIAGVKSRIDDDDVLVIYGTGHGGDGKEICLKSGCLRNPLVKQLDSLKYGKRVIAFDSCYGGNLSSFFTDNPKTLFISAGAKGSTTCCNNFAPVFWKRASQLKDLNRDGIVSWQERYAAAYKGHHDEHRMFVQTQGYLDFDVERGRNARLNFPARPIEVTTYAALQSQLKKLKPGEYAVIGFAMRACLGCKTYKPKFFAAARQARGRHLFIWSNSYRIRRRYGIKSVPHVVIMDAFGRIYGADMANISKSLAGMKFSVGQMVDSAVARIRLFNRNRSNQKNDDVLKAVNHIGKYILHMSAAKALSIVPVLQPLLKEPYAPTRFAAGFVYAKLLLKQKQGLVDKKAVALRRMMKSNKRMLRESAARVYGELDPRLKVRELNLGAMALIPMLKDRSFRIRHAATWAFKNLAPRVSVKIAGLAAPLLRKIIANQNLGWTYKHAIEAYGQLGQDLSSHEIALGAPVIRQAMVHSDVGIRRVAVAAYGNLHHLSPSEASAGVAVLRGRLRDSDKLVAFYAALSYFAVAPRLDKRGTNRESRFLQALMKDRDYRHRAVSLMLYKKLIPKVGAVGLTKAEKEVRARMKDVDARVRLQAARTYAALAPRLKPTILRLGVKELRRLVRDSNPDVRFYAKKALKEVITRVSKTCPTCPR